MQTEDGQADSLHSLNDTSQRMSVSYMPHYRSDLTTTELGTSRGIKFTKSPYNATLVSVVALHVEVAIVCDGENVGWHFPNLLVGVEAYLFGRVNRKQLVRVHSHQDRACVSLERSRGKRHKDSA